MRIHYYLEIAEIDGDRKIRCRHCGRVLCDASENYKHYAPRAEVWPDEIPGGRPSKDNALVLYYEYYCPECYTLLDVEVAEKGDAPLWDIQINV